MPFVSSPTRPRREPRAALHLAHARRLLRSAFFYALVVVVGACAGPSSDEPTSSPNAPEPSQPAATSSGPEQAAFGHVTLPSKLMGTGNETVATDSATYAAGTPIHVTWTNFPGNVYDWISISLNGSLDGSYVSYQYAYGAAAGSADFTGIGPGTYVARGHENNGSTVLASSTTFTVTGSGTSVSTDKSGYTQAESATVTYASMQGNTNDWISIAPAGSAATTYLSYQYTGGGLSGSKVFPLAGLATGDYVARAYFNDSFTIAAESAVFHVGMTVTTDKSAYAVAEDITASWSNLPGNAHDWIALAYQGSAAASYVRWTYTNGATTGSYSFQGLSAGTYVARAFLDDGTAIATESAPFQVGATPTVATDKTAYTTAETAQVTFANAPSTMDWIAIAADGSPLSSYVTWQSTGGGAGGTVGLSLAGLSTGTYVARLFTNNTYDLVASSATFAVSAGASTTTVTSDAATYNAGDTVTIHYAGMTGSTSDWIGISAPAAPAGQYIQWAYINAMTSGSQPFYNLPPGTYVARAYFNNGSVVQAESGQFTVQGSTTCTTDKTTYANGETVTVSYTGMLGHALDWVSLSAPGSPEGSYVYWTFTGGGVAGSKAFANVAPGTYVARCYFQSENTVRASSPQITVNTPSSTDSDGDGMPDDWEVAHGLSPLVPDAFDDLDGDGFPNVFEYAAGSDPNDRNSTPTPTFVVHGAGGGTHTTVSAAIAAANAGTNNYPIIGIAPGTYAGSGNVGLSISSSKKLLILGLEGAAKTIFDGGGTSTGWVVNNAAVIASVTFQRMSSWALWVSVSSGELRLVDLLMKDNVSTSYAAGVHVYSASKLSIVGSTFINNTGNASYEQIYLGSGAATIQNTVVWGASSNPMLLKAGSASLSANYCLIKGQMLSGTGNLAGTTDPKLRADGRLPWDSPLRGAGGSVGQSRLDMDGELRPTTGPDIGVDQFEDVDGDGLADVWELSSLGDLTRRRLAAREPSRPSPRPRSQTSS